jgi:hypothetical protein
MVGMKYQNLLLIQGLFKKRAYRLYTVKIKKSMNTNNNSVKNYKWEGLREISVVKNLFVTNQK